MNKNEFVSSAQFNYMIDLPWLIEQYPSSLRHKPLTIVHDPKRTLDHDSLQSTSTNIESIRAKLDSPWGTHHTKMMLLLYTTGMRVVVHTANLIVDDWHQKTQGFVLNLSNTTKAF